MLRISYGSLQRQAMLYFCAGEQGEQHEIGSLSDTGKIDRICRANVQRHAQAQNNYVRKTQDKSHT